ncbi:ARM repeat-containing protein [Dichomitus squalens]|uniref:ARM repeat-containing protein n=1 Tax=Dichomitus squalens (strain LYAD-421) TaxID=732165 RepID=UPI0004411712|nr:ARM repeat-containing protein [Dichomitus squalens LYAD-421 SS1]EJF65952.1 ARM repeat-containing protein [Dichomitus squalens LYAD-421 SS1]TBU50882.1 ARM repeat-containing protein [Dichomitus squalens]
MYPHAGPGGGPGFVHGGRHGRRGDGAVRSAQLDEFRANKSRKWELRDIFGYIVEFSGDQHGSRFIQQKLESASSEEMEIVFDEIVPQYAVQLMQDVFGNYVVQKMFEYGTAAQKARLVSTMEGQVLGLSLQMYGCRVVQKAIEYVGPDQQVMFVQELSPSVLRCVKDANGNHVIQKIIEHVVPERLAFVNAFRGSVYELSTHPYGCRVLQRCFEYLPDEQTRPLLDELHKYVSNLMIDQFGNYVVQFVLEHGTPQDRAMIIAKLTGQMNNMAKHKFASNVCEKALVTADPDSRRQLIDEIMTPKQQDGPSPLMSLMKDSFGNYVLQRALTVAEGEQKEQLISKVRPHLVNMRRYSSAYSKHLSASKCNFVRSARHIELTVHVVERLLEKFSSNAPSSEVTPVEGPTDFTS